MKPQPRTEDKPARAAPEDWLLLVASLPTGDPPARMLILRTLEALGVAMLREGVFILPDEEDKRHAVAHLADYIARNDGSARVFRAASFDPAQQQALRSLFDRSARYDALVKVVEGLRLGFGVSDPGALSRVLHKQRREYEAISALDFFPSAARERAEAALAEAETAVRKLLYPASAGRSPRAAEPLLRRSWATRRPLWADRLACAWLIRRFIDPEATLLWLDKGETCPDEALGFGYAGARFDNSETRVAFEEMLARFDLAGNHALARIGAIVHGLEAQGTPVPEAAGVQTLLQGATRRSSSEDELLRECEKTFDLLYDAYYEAPAR
jgi:hypothetical protein